jgi:hypothetical protein
MIKRQYHYYGGRNGDAYFCNFVDAAGGQEHIRTELTKWKATVAKSKAKYTYNVKFHDEQLYMIFRIKFS